MKICEHYFTLYYSGRGDIPWTNAEAELQEKLAEIIQEMKPHM